MIGRAFAFVLCGLAAFASAARADAPVEFHVSGDGVFNPANIGKPQGGNAGIVLGDGSGLSAYVASGDDFVLGGVDLGALGQGFNAHYGANRSWTTGIARRGVVVWPAHSAPNPLLEGSPDVHIMTSALGDIYFRYPGYYTLDPATGALVGDANFIVVGGTGLFAGASGLVDVHVVATGPNPAGGVNFHYEFDGFVSLKRSR
jgi:hypothetical protein